VAPGLASRFVNRIIEDHHGQFVWKRTSLWREIRCRAAARPRIPDGYLSARNMHNILIVDDEPAIRNTQGVLEDEGYKASVAESGEACIESFAQAAPLTWYCSTSGARNGWFGDA